MAETSENHPLRSEVRKWNIGLKKLKHNLLLIYCHYPFSLMPSFLDLAELKRLKTGGAAFVVRANH